MPLDLCPPSDLQTHQAWKGPMMRVLSNTSSLSIHYVQTLGLGCCLEETPPMPPPPGNALPLRGPGRLMPQRIPASAQSHGKRSRG